MKKPDHKMSIQDRAKQFSPFAALKGLEEALAAREKILVDKIELSEEMYEQLDAKMHLIKKGTIITVIHFNKGEYIKTSGMVSKIDETSRILQIVNTKIQFDDVLDIILQ